MFPPIVNNSLSRVERLPGDEGARRLATALAQLTQLTKLDVDVRFNKIGAGPHVVERPRSASAEAEQRSKTFLSQSLAMVFKVVKGISLPATPASLSRPLAKTRLKCLLRQCTDLLVLSHLGFRIASVIEVFRGCYRSVLKMETQVLARLMSFV